MRSLYLMIICCFLVFSIYAEDNQPNTTYIKCEFDALCAIEKSTEIIKKGESIIAEMENERSRSIKLICDYIAIAANDSKEEIVKEINNFLLLHDKAKQDKLKLTQILSDEYIHKAKAYIFLGKNSEAIPDLLHAISYGNRDAPDIIKMMFREIPGDKK